MFVFSEWPKMFPKCGEPKSSPIEIDLNTDEPFPALNSSLRFRNYDANINLLAENTGHGGDLYANHSLLYKYCLGNKSSVNIKW